jgi:anti-sigma-K factor RskA
VNWHQSPALVDRLAAAYALGTLAGPARRRFEAVMRQQPAVARAVAGWDERLAPLGQRLKPIAASADLWARIERRAFGAAGRTVAEAAASVQALSWWKRLLSPIPSAALAFGLALGVLLPSLGSLLQGDQLDTQLPESYVGVLAGADGRTGMIVSSLRHGRVMDLKQVQPVPVSSGQTLYLWAIEAEGRARPIGPVPQGKFVQVLLAQTSEQLFGSSVELALTVEPSAAAPAGPSGPFVYRGLCGKLWRVTTP